LIGGDVDHTIDRLNKLAELQEKFKNESFTKTNEFNLPVAEDFDFEGRSIEEIGRFFDQFAFNDEYIDAFHEWAKMAKFDLEAIGDALVEGDTTEFVRMMDAYREFLSADLSSETISQMLASTATSIEELSDLYIRGKIGIDEYKQGLLPLIDNIEDLNNAFKHGLISGEDYASVLDKVLEAEADLHDLDAGEIKNYAKYLEDAAKDLDFIYDELDSGTALSASKEIQLMNKGFGDLLDNLEDWKKVLNKNNKSTTEYQNTIEKFREALEDMLGVEQDVLDDVTMTPEILDLMEKAANGSYDAFDKLRDLVAEDYLKNALKDTVGEWNDDLAALV